ncbi:MAG: hypothetical protein HWE23_02955 [Rhodobacteraceae bacterium]|nr:hypothetical protein [Paracoccaceae bacterium]
MKRHIQHVIQVLEQERFPDWIVSIGRRQSLLQVAREEPVACSFDTMSGPMFSRFMTGFLGNAHFERFLS